VILRWSRDLARPPALVHPPTGRDLWCADDGLAIAEDRALWWLRDDCAWSIDGDFSAVHRIDGGVGAWADGESFLLRDGSVTRTDGRATSRGVVRREGITWNVPWDANLPEGALRASHIWPSPDGAATFWYDADNGYLYRKDARIQALATLSRAPVVATGPGGSAIVDGALAIAPGHAAVVLERELAPERWLRFSEDGLVAAGATDDDTTALVDLRTGCVLREERGLPVDQQCRFDADTGAVDDRPLGLLDATPALSGEILAGPGGATWDLRSGRRLSPWGVIALGATSSVDGGFLTVRWDTGLARLVHTDGTERWRCRIPFDEGDVVTRAQGDVVVLASGAAFRVGPEGCTPVPAPRRGRNPRPQAPVPVEGIAEIGGRTWGWRADGLLIAWTDR
jgi:hypothetical protein